MVLTAEDSALIQKFLSAIDLRAALQMQDVRFQLAEQRSLRLKDEDIRTHQNLDPAVVKNALEHNLAQMKKAASIGRCDFLINVLRSVEYVARNIPHHQVLSVGPRNEAELFYLLSLGYSVSQVHGLDLISYSPMVDLGDMHQMPYPDASFDVIILGWVVSYSKEPERLAREIMRVARAKAVIAIGTEYDPHTPAQIKASGTLLSDDCPVFKHTDEFLRLFEGRIQTVYFRHDVTEDRKNDYSNIMTVFQLK